MGIMQYMVGAVVAGVATLILGAPGLVLGLLLAFAYYGRATKK